MGIVATSAFAKFQIQFYVFISERLKRLLETKHLYQKVSFQPDDIVASLIPTEPKVVSPSVNVSHERQDFLEMVGGFVTQPLIPIDVPKPIDNKSYLAVTNVKLFCAKSDAREAFRPIWLEDVTGQLLLQREAQVSVRQKETFRISFRSTFQLFVLVFQCQHCLGAPEMFLVKRDDTDLIIEGRSPIEHIELPSFIPKEEKHWFRDAVVAFQTGKVLAALFYLRTFVEQFARRMTGTQNDKKTGDEILCAYADTIPPNLRDTMPSLRECYDRLSAALHGAKEDSELFEETREMIEEHFDIRRVHKLDLKAPAVGGDGAGVA